MSAKYEITFHKELSMFNCSCGFFGLSHHCTRKIKGTISIVSCPEDCKLCHKEADRKEYISLRWKKNKDGYDVCGICYNKLSSSICESYFCKVCYVFLSENCPCPK